MPFCHGLGDVGSGGAAALSGVGVQLWGTLTLCLGVPGTCLLPAPLGHSQCDHLQLGQEGKI